MKAVVEVVLVLLVIAGHSDAQPNNCKLCVFHCGGHIGMSCVEGCQLGTEPALCKECLAVFGCVGCYKTCTPDCDSCISKCEDPDAFKCAYSCTEGSDICKTCLTQHKCEGCVFSCIPEQDILACEPCVAEKCKGTDASECVKYCSEEALEMPYICDDCLSSNNCGTCVNTCSNPVRARKLKSDRVLAQMLMAIRMTSEVTAA